MTPKKLRLLLAMMIVVVTGVLVAGVLRPTRDGVGGAAVRAARILAPLAPVSPAVAPAPAVKPSQALEEPSLLAGFSSASVPDQLECVTRLSADSRWPDDVSSWLLRRIQDRGGDPTVRNNIANGLLLQDGADAQALHRLFATMVTDAQEDEVWRAYAVQHLTSTVEIGADAGAVLSDLLGFARVSSGVVAGTALMQLARLEAAGRVRVRPLLVRAALDRLAMTSGDTQGRMAAVAVLGDLRASEAAPTIRAIANGEPALRRVAIASLGRIGEVTDRDLLQAAIADGDPLVVRAAAAALGQPAFAGTLPSDPH